MEIWQWQLGTVIPLGIMCAYLYFMMSGLMRSSKGTGEILWVVEYERAGKKGCLELPEGNFLAGTGFFNDIRMNTGGKGVRLYLNVQRTSIALSVLRGKMHMGNVTYKKDLSEHISISDGKVVLIEEMKLTFVRKKVV